MHRFCRLIKEQAGQAMTEFAIGAPTLLLLFAVTVDLGRAISTYSVASQIAYEGARYATSTPGLETGTFNRTTPPPPGGTHSKVQDRLTDLLVRKKLWDATTDVVTDYVKNSNKPGQSSNNLVRVTINMNYRPVFSVVPSFPMSVRAYGPYLYPD